jgi:hypothetical protein
MNQILFSFYGNYVSILSFYRLIIWYTCILLLYSSKSLSKSNQVELLRKQIEYLM